MSEKRIPIGITGEYLDTELITQDDSGLPAHREAVFIADPTNPSAKAKVTNTIPEGDDYGLFTRSVLVGESDQADGVYRNANVDRNNHLDIVAHAHPEGGHVLFKKTFSASEDVIVIDLSDTTNYPHEYTGRIHTANIVLEIDATTNAEYLIQLGFLENVDATNGDFHEVFVVDGSKKSGNSHFISIAQSPESPQLISTKFVGPVESNQTSFQTDVNLRSTLDPAGTAATQSGSGDMVMRVAHTAGSYTVSCMIGYHSHPSS